MILFELTNPQQVAHARLNKSGLRPLGRTQSAPLPLGHPLLQGAPGVPGVVPGVVPAVAGVAPVPITQQQFELYLRERQLYEQQQQHNMLIQVSLTVLLIYYYYYYYYYLLFDLFGLIWVSLGLVWFFENDSFIRFCLIELLLLLIIFIIIIDCYYKKYVLLIY